jgi:hypothetical protein
MAAASFVRGVREQKYSEQQEQLPTKKPQLQYNCGYY